MTIKKFFDLFKQRDAIVKRCIEEESNYYFTRLEEIQDKFFASFYSQAVCCTIADAYDFFSYLHSRNNVFYQNVKQLTPETGRQIYKWNAMYQTIRFVGGVDTIKSREHIDYMFYVFEFTSEEQEACYKFMNMYKESPACFEVEFSKKASGHLFDNTAQSPIMLAFVNNFFYNSFKEFMNAYVSYVMI